MELIPRLLKTSPEPKTAPDSTPELTFELCGEAPPEGAPPQVGEKWWGMVLVRVRGEGFYL
jgi:hypothetical protein